MDPVTFPAAEAEFDRLVDDHAVTLGVDPVCSTTNWIVPNAAAFAAGSEPRVFAAESGMLALLEHDDSRGPVLTGFDAVWGFATPLIGPDPKALVADLARSVLGALDHYALTLSGIDPAGALFAPLQQLGPVGFNETADRCVADLSGGFEAWLGRRSSRFRRSLRTAVTRAEAAGVEVEACSPTKPADVTATLDRILGVEMTSWKTDIDSGLVGTNLGFFTQLMSHRFARSGSLRALFARLDGRDIGYVIGARHHDRYRGFQHSFDQTHADLSIGKVLQFHNIASLCAEGAMTYDMGMHMDYKESYTDRVESTITLIFANRR